MGLAQRMTGALAFLTASPRRLEGRAPTQAQRLAGPLMLLGLAWGLAMIAVYDLTSRLLFRRLLSWLVPSILCAAATVLGPYRRACLSLAGLIPDSVRRLRLLRWLVVAAVAAVLAAMYHDLGYSDPDWPTKASPYWAWLWPKATYRAVLLAPVWGAWGTVILGQFHRPCPRTDAASRRFVEAVRPLAAAAYMALPMAGTFIYLQHLFPPWRFVPPAAAVMAALAGGAAMVRLFGGICRSALLATNLLTQMAFLAACASVM